MKKSLRGLSSAHVLSLIALFVALGGTGYAAATGSIDGREIKNNSVASKDVKNGSIVSKDIKASTRSALKGQKGDPGAAGAAGAPGTARAYGVVTKEGALVPSQSKGVVGIRVPAGNPNVYCIKLAPSISAAAVRPVATINFNDRSNSGTPTVLFGNEGLCTFAQNEASALTFGEDAGGVVVAAPQGFSFVIP